MAHHLLFFLGEPFATLTRGLLRSKQLSKAANILSLFFFHFFDSAVFLPFHFVDILKSYFNTGPFINSDGKRRAKQLNNFPWAVSVDSVLDIGENPRHGVKVNSRHQWSSSNGPASCHHVEMGGYQTIWFYQLS